MSEKKKGLLTLITGAVLGAAAVIFSKKENRDKAAEIAKKTGKEAQKLAKDFKENPEKVMKDAKKTVVKTAEKVTTEIKNKLASANKTDKK